ncbi:MAG: hypothetical protein EXR79_05690 [Myxococcales bacterium]|nr:hypothetical protein [Myxococcales bacterium]
MNEPSREPVQRALVLRWIGLLANAALVAACENPVETRPNKLPSLDAGTVADAAGDGSATDLGPVATATCDCLKVGDWFRFTKLELESIDGDSKAFVIGALNPVWQADIDKLELNFYMEVKEIKPDRVKFRVVNGARVAGTKPADGKTCVLQYTSTDLEHVRNGCNLGGSPPSKMNVFAGTPTNTKNCSVKGPVKHVIPVRQAVLESVLSADCNTLGSGRVTSGSIAKDGLLATCTCLALGKDLAEDVCLPPDPAFKDESNGGVCAGCAKGFQNLKTLLESFNGGEDLAYKCKAEDGGPAVCITARYAGKRLEGPPPPDCP